MATKRKPVILCTGDGSAVIFGWVEEIPEIDQPFEAFDARMILYWPEECKGLLGLAADGPKEGLRLTPTVPFTRSVTKQVVAVNKNAAEELKKWIS